MWLLFSFRLLSLDKLKVLYFSKELTNQNYILNPGFKQMGFVWRNKTYIWSLYSILWGTDHLLWHHFSTLLTQTSFFFSSHLPNNSHLKVNRQSFTSCSSSWDGEEMRAVETTAKMQCVLSKAPLFLCNAKHVDSSLQHKPQSPFNKKKFNKLKGPVQISTFLCTILKSEKTQSYPF